MTYPVIPERSGNGEAPRRALLHRFNLDGAGTEEPAGVPPPIEPLPPASATLDPSHEGDLLSDLGVAALGSEIIDSVQRLIAQNQDMSVLKTKPERLHALIEQALDQTAGAKTITLTPGERRACVEMVRSELIGLGPIDRLLHDNSVSEIMVNGPKLVYFERKGQLIKADVTFKDDQHVMRIIDSILSPLGRRCDVSQPYVDARLPDGSRVNVIIPPLAIDGPCLTIRKFSKTPLQAEDLIKFGSMTAEMASFLEACIKGKLNIIISGGTGSGKTTVLNVLSGYIPDKERIVTIEDAAELRLHQVHVVRLETRPPNIEGKGKVSIRDLVINALRMRPDRLIVGECRGGEALDMLQAMNTGHAGSMTTIHANGPRDAISRLETLVLMSGMDLPVRAIRDQISKAIDLIVQLERLLDGSRRVVAITEVQGLEMEAVVMQDIFTFRQEGIERETGRVIGRMQPTGIRPKFTQKLEQYGHYLSPDVFGARSGRF